MNLCGIYKLIVAFPYKYIMQNFYNPTVYGVLLALSISMR
jgi:hypothetical protein